MLAEREYKLPSKWSEQYIESRYALRIFEFHGGIWALNWICECMQECLINIQHQLMSELRLDFVVLECGVRFSGFTAKHMLNDMLGILLLITIASDVLNAEQKWYGSSYYSRLHLYK